MIQRFLPLILAALAASASACAPNQLPTPDGGDAGLVPVTRRLVFDPPDELRLEPGARVPLAAVLTDYSGAPVVGETVRFALVGDAQDGSLDVTRQTTDAAGRAPVVLTAPSRASTLRLRALAPQAPDVYLTVSVSAAGFGGVAVRSQYTGVRGPSSLAVELFEGLRCGALDMADPVRTGSLPTSGGVVTFGSLPAGQTFAVRGEAVGVGGAVLARGCIDGLTVVRDTDLQTTLTWTDLPLRVDGSYALGLAFDLGALPAATARDELDAVDAELASGGNVDGEAGYLLAALAAAVASADPGALPGFEAARPRLLTSLEMDLVRRSASPRAALAALASDATAVAQSVDGQAVLDVHTGADGNATVALSSLALRVDPLTPDIASDDVGWAPAVSPPGTTGSAVVLPADRVSVSLGGLPLPYAAITRHALDALLARMGVASTSEWVQLATRCRDVAPLVTDVTGRCDATCVETACNAAVGRLGASFDAAAALSGSSHGYADVLFGGPARAGAGALRIASVESGALSGAYHDDPTAQFTGVATLTTP